MKKLIVITAFVLLGTLVNSANAGKVKTTIHQAAGKINGDAATLDDIQDVYGNIIRFEKGNNAGEFLVEIDEQVNCESIILGTTQNPISAQETVDVVVLATTNNAGHVNTYTQVIFNVPDGAPCQPTTLIAFAVEDSFGVPADHDFQFTFVGRLTK